MGWRMASKRKKPTIFQAKILQQIAQSPLMKTHRDGKTIWGLQNGREISDKCAEALIRNGWVKAVSPGLWPGDDQTYTALKP